MHENLSVCQNCSHREQSFMDDTDGKAGKSQLLTPTDGNVNIVSQSQLCPTCRQKGVSAKSKENFWKNFMLVKNVDENGWANIHHAAFRGFIQSVEQFIKDEPALLELETQNDEKLTPLLLAVKGGHKSVVELLLDLNANIDGVDGGEQGVVELCALKKNISLLQYFIELNSISVWQPLIQLMLSQNKKEAEAGAECLKLLTHKKGEEENIPYLEDVFQIGIIPAICNVLKSIEKNTSLKCLALETLLNLIADERVKEKAMSAGLMESLMKHLSSKSEKLIELSARILTELCSILQYTDHAMKIGVFPLLMKDLQNLNDNNTLACICDTIGEICEINPAHKATVLNTPDAVRTLTNLYEKLNDKYSQIALTRNITKFVNDNEANQNAFISAGITEWMLPLIQAESRKQNDIRMVAIVAVNKLAKKNLNSQRVIREAGIVKPLLHLLKRSRQMEQQEKIAGALWSIAGEKIETKTTMGHKIGVPALVEFLSMGSHDLHLIGSEGLGVLAQGADSRIDEIYENNGVSSLVRLLRYANEMIGLRVVRTLGFLSVRVGYKPHYKIQNIISRERGTDYIMSFLLRSRNPLMQVEAANCLACLSLGNRHILEEIKENTQFSFIRILKMLFNEDPMVCLLAGASLACFAYNSLQNQREICEQGGIHFSRFQNFLQSENEFYRANAAFQIVVLAPVISDQTQAVTCAVGIKILIDLLQNSKKKKVPTATLR